MLWIPLPIKLTISLTKQAVDVNGFATPVCLSLKNEPLKSGGLRYYIQVIPVPPILTIIYLVAYALAGMAIGALTSFSHDKVWTARAVEGCIPRDIWVRRCLHWVCIYAVAPKHDLV